MLTTEEPKCRASSFTTGSAEHPEHRAPDEVVSTMRKLRDVEIADETRQEELAAVARPTIDERKLFSRSAANGSANDESEDNSLLQLRNSRIKRIHEAIQKQVRTSAALRPFRWSEWVLEQPARIDNSFWWARTDWWHSDRTPPEPDEGSAAHFTAGMASDGLRFNGGVTTHDGDLYFDSFGAVALFELQPNRIPGSGSGLWNSSPRIEVFGGLTAHTSPGGIFWGGDSWSKCWMHLDHQLFQWGFGPTGPVPIIRGQAHAFETLVFEENDDRTIHVPMPGFRLMPPITFGNINTASSLWARIEIKFDIQTEGAGSLLWLDPDALLRTFQWPLAAV